MIPGDARLLLATIKGEIDVLERSVLEGVGDPAASAPAISLPRWLTCWERGGERGNLCGLRFVIIGGGPGGGHDSRRTHGLCPGGGLRQRDGVVFSGFSSLMALDKEPARPFDKQRAGLSIGEAAGYLLLMSRERAEREGRTILGEITGWGMSDDANHMTGPCRESEGLIRAIRAALKSAGMGPERVGFISAHGTGTQYNDAMEMRAFHGVFGERALRSTPSRGDWGTPWAPAGLVEIALAQRAQREGVVPPTVNLSEPDDDACGWVSSRCRSVPRRIGGNGDQRRFQRHQYGVDPGVRRDAMTIRIRGIGWVTKTGYGTVRTGEHTPFAAEEGAHSLGKTGALYRAVPQFPAS